MDVSFFHPASLSFVKDVRANCLGPLLRVKRERPLIITYSLHSENIMHYHFVLKTLQRKRIELLMLKIWHYLNHKGHFYLCEKRKTNAYLDVYGRFREVSGGFADL